MRRNLPKKQKTKQSFNFQKNGEGRCARVCEPREDAEGRNESRRSEAEQAIIEGKHSMLSHKPVLFKCFILFKDPGKAGLLLKFQVAKYSPLWGVAGDQVEIVVKVHCGTVLGDKTQCPCPSRPDLPRNLKVAKCNKQEGNSTARSFSWFYFLFVSCKSSQGLRS